MAEIATEGLTQELAARIEQALSGVIDPCSRFNGTHLSFVELGMIEELRQVSDGHIAIRLLLDDPFCLYMVDIHTSVHDALMAVDGVESAEIEIVPDRVWGPERMTPATQAAFARWREVRRRRVAELQRNSGAPSRVTMRST